MDDRRVARAGTARRWAGLAAVAVAFTGAAPAVAAPFVVVDAELRRDAGGARVVATIAWDGAAARAEPHRMTVGDVRVVAVGERGHRPALLATARADGLDDDARRTLRLRIEGDDALAAIRPGNRVVLTASQHGPASEGARTERTYVTVAELQPFGSPQDRIGRRTCDDVAVEPGAVLNGCDLVGAHLDHAIVSVRRPAGTRMLLADLTGATLVDADLTGLSVAGGRLNGADATRAILDNLSLAGAEATGLVARDATSDRLQGTAGADVFDADLTKSDFRGALLNGVSLSHSRFDGADFREATFNGVLAEQASFREADLRGLHGVGSSVYLADFTGARLRGAPFSALDLAWATLCRTEMPDGEPAGGEDRDCRARVDPGPVPPEPRPIVVVDDAGIDRDGDRIVIGATVRWSAAARAAGLTAGDVRVVAIDGSTGVPTTVGSLSIAGGLPSSSRFTATVDDRASRAALRPGNRVVLTATQHPPLPRSSRELTDGSAVTVATLQPGPGRGRVGDRDCSGLLISALAPVAGGYDRCDLPGAVLRQTALPGPMRLADLTGADLRDAGMGGLVLDGAALGGVSASGADASAVSMRGAWAPALSMPATLIRSAQLRAAQLGDADFRGATISDTTFATAPMRRAAFSGAAFDKVDLAYAGLAGARLDDVDAESSDPRRGRRSSLFLADLTDATLAGSAWDDDEAGDRPWRWATLCRTTLPPDASEDGDRDCPRQPRAERAADRTGSISAAAMRR